MTVVQYPEVALLARLIGPSAAETVAHSPGGWRDLTERELEGLDVSPKERDAVRALQELVAHYSTSSKLAKRAWRSVRTISARRSSP
jgi:hypothetical protein